MHLNYLLNAARILGLLLMPFSATMLPSLILGLCYQENTIYAFSLSTLITFFTGFLLWLPSRKYPRELQPREAFLIVTLIWLVLSIISALPFLFLRGLIQLSFIEIFFETISGLTTTGATVLSNLESLPLSLLYYRQQLQFIGGGGMILLGIAILPMLSIGGMQLIRAEMPGPFKEDKLTPRITQTAKTLWFIYVGLVITCCLCYKLGGMPWFDAISYSFSTISTGGFGTHDNSFSYFQSPLLESISVFFMMLGAINFSLHFLAIQRRNLNPYWQDPELRTFIMLWSLIVLLTVGALFYFHTFKQVNTTLIKGIFQVTTFFTTTGFFSTSFYEWPTFIPLTLTFAALIGGCAGSTAGGVKIIRLLIMKKLESREIKRLIHPNGHYLIKIGPNSLTPRTLDAIFGFFCIFINTFIVIFLVLVGLGLHPLTAFSALSASISNTGLLLGNAPENFAIFNDTVKGILSIAMLAGRLELFTLLILLSPSYWRY